MSVSVLIIQSYILSIKQFCLGGNLSLVVILTVNEMFEATKSF